MASPDDLSRRPSSTIERTFPDLDNLKGRLEESGVVGKIQITGGCLVWRFDNPLDLKTFTLIQIPSQKNPEDPFLFNPKMMTVTNADESQLRAMLEDNTYVGKYVSVGTGPEGVKIVAVLSYPAKAPWDLTIGRNGQLTYREVERVLPKPLPTSLSSPR